MVSNNVVVKILFTSGECDYVKVNKGIRSVMDLVEELPHAPGLYGVFGEDLVDTGAYRYFVFSKENLAYISIREEA